MCGFFFIYLLNYKSRYSGHTILVALLSVLLLLLDINSLKYLNIFNVYSWFSWINNILDTSYSRRLGKYQNQDPRLRKSDSIVWDHTEQLSASTIRLGEKPVKVNERAYSG